MTRASTRRAAKAAKNDNDENNNSSSTTTTVVDKENANNGSATVGKHSKTKSIAALNDKLKRILQEGELELEDRCSSLTSKGNVYCTKIENAFALQIMRLPKSVQSMPLEEFKSTYGFDVRAAIKNVGGTKRKAGIISGGSSSSSSSKGMVVPQTPSGRTTNSLLSNFSAIKTSFVRRQRDGDQSSSTNNDSNNNMEDLPKVELELTDAVTGKQINASDPNAAKNLTAESKQEVLSHLSSLQDQISDLMKQFS